MIRDILKGGGVALLAAAVCAAPTLAEAPPLPFPGERIEVAFDLTDQTGARVSEQDMLGKPWLLFFGYANCEAICTVALPVIGEAMEILDSSAQGGTANITPVMITVDPRHDTPQALAEAMPQYHPRFVGLTGSEDALSAVRARFQIERTVLFEAPDGSPVYAHGSFIYLIDADGAVKTLIPPILSPARIAELVRQYL